MICRSSNTSARTAGPSSRKSLFPRPAAYFVGSVKALMLTSYSLYSPWRRARTPILLPRLTHAEHVAHASGACAESSLASPVDGHGEMGGVARLEFVLRDLTALDYPQIQNLRLGTSSWSSQDWVGVFYPPGTASADFISEYAKHFDTVEVDSWWRIKLA